MMELLGYCAAIFMGLSLGVIGGGGSILTVPILVYFFKQDAAVATTGSLFVVGSTALLGALMNAKKGNINFKIGVMFAIPSFAGVFLTRKIILPLIPNSIGLPFGFLITKSLLILIAFAALMIFASRAMIASGKGQAVVDHSGNSQGLFNVAIKGFLIGCTTGFVGAGGGFLIIPALVILLHVPMRKAVGTSLGIITANSLFGFSLSFGNQVIEWKLLLSIAFLGIIGLLVGHRFSSHFPEGKLKKSFGYFVLVVGTIILIDQISKMFNA